jgi:hypothetical protein
MPADTQVTICAGVVGTALPPRSPTPTEGSIASSNGFGPAGPGMTHAVRGRGSVWFGLSGVGLGCISSTLLTLDILQKYAAAACVIR